MSKNENRFVRHKEEMVLLLDVESLQMHTELPPLCVCVCLNMLMQARTKQFLFLHSNQHHQHRINVCRLSFTLNQRR